MTNDEFILGLIETEVQRGFIATGNEKGFIFIYRGSILVVSRYSDVSDFYFYFIGERKKYFISKKTYEISEKYFYGTNYSKLKNMLKKDLRKIRLNNINDRFVDNKRYDERT